jgi:Thioesterase domain
MAGAPAAPSTAPQATQRAPDTLSALFRGAIQGGQVERAFDLLRAVANLRPKFASPADLEQVATGVRLAGGPKRPRLICLSTPMVTGGVHQHARLVSHLTGRYAVAIPTPGFAAGDALPVTPEAGVMALAQSVIAAADGEPFVLLGYSSGGTLAYATASHLETDLGVRPAGVVLLDTFKVHEGGGAAIPMQQLAFGLFDKEEMFGGFDSARLSAMGCWFDLLPNLALGHVEAPVLFVQCVESFFGDGDGGGDGGSDGGGDSSGPDWRAKPWNPSHTLRTVAANHFNMIEDRAGSTARVIEEWLDSTPATGAG